MVMVDVTKHTWASPISITTAARSAVFFTSHAALIMSSATLSHSSLATVNLERPSRQWFFSPSVAPILTCAVPPTQAYGMRPS